MNKEILEKAGIVLYGSRFQTDLAKKLNVNDRTMRRWLSGESNTPELGDELIKLIDEKVAELKLLKKIVLANTWQHVGYSANESVEISANYKAVRIGGDVQYMNKSSTARLKKTGIAELNGEAVRLFNIESKKEY